MPSASVTMCMEFAVPMPEHTPGLLNGVLAHAQQIVERQLAGDVMARAQEHLLDVDVMVVGYAAALIAADHQQRRDVEAGRRHQMARHASCRRR